MKNDGHVIMKKSLARALMDAGMHHYDGGGVISAGTKGAGILGGIAGGMTTQNSFQASGPDMNQVVGAQGNLAGQLQGEAAGGGPNPAQIQYQQNAQNIAQQQAATNAQNRALNPGLAARLSGNQAVASGQQAAGGAAAQQAEQQIAAQQQLNQLLAQQQNASLQAAGINSQISQNNANAVNQTQGGLFSGIGSALTSLFAKGGEVDAPDHIKKMAEVYHPKKYAVGGSINVPGVPNFSNAQVLLEQQQQAQKGQQKAAPSTPTPLSATPGNNFGAQQLMMPELGSSEGLGASPAAPGLGLDSLGAGAGGASAADLAPLLAAKSGGKIPGKAAVKGNSYKNDTVPALVSPGEVVLPRSVTQAKDAPSKAAEFMKHIMDKNKKDDDSEPGYEKVAKAKRRGKK